MNIIFVDNPKSGSALSRSEVRRVCKRYGVSVDKFIAISGDLDKDLTRYTQSKTIIAAFGGDGTISAVASVLQGTPAVLMPLPGGTLNHFTKDLKIDQSFEQAIKHASSSRPKKVDIASFNDHFFINNSSIGLYPFTLTERKKTEKLFGKWPAAVVAVCKSLILFKRRRVVIDGENIKTPFIFIGNNNYSIEGFGAPERTSINAGALCVYIAKTPSRLSLLKVMMHALVGTARSLDEFELRQPKHMTIESQKKSFQVSKDGEVVRCDSPLRYDIHPGALNVLY